MYFYRFKYFKYLFTKWKSTRPHQLTPVGCGCPENADEVLQLSVFPTDEWRQTEIEFLGTWWHVSTYAITSFYCRKGSANMSCSRKIKCTEVFVGEGMVNRIKVDKRQEWPKLNVSWVRAINRLTSINNQPLYQRRCFYSHTMLFVILWLFFPLLIISITLYSEYTREQALFQTWELQQWPNRQGSLSLQSTLSISKNADYEMGFHNQVSCNLRLKIKIWVMIWPHKIS